jgi:hypothetical protein
MGRLFNLMFWLLVTLTVVIFALREASTRSPSSLASLFTNPDGTPCERPCLFGVRLGKMAIDEAIALVKTHWLLSNVRELDTENYEFALAGMGSGAFTGNQFLIRLAPGPGDQNPILVTGVGVAFTEPGGELSSHLRLPIVTLGTFVSFAGTPHSFGLASYERSQNFFFPEQGIVAHVEPRSGITHFPHLDDVVTDFYVSGPYTWTWDVKWCGFTVRQCGRIE